MSLKKPVSWFLTDAGKRFSFGLITCTGIGFSAAKFLPHTFLIENYKDFVHYYSNGQPVKVPEQLQHRYEKCLEILKIPNTLSKLLTPFSVFGFDLFHAGTYQSRFGGIIGIPVHFNYKSKEDIYNSDIQVNNKKVDWHSEAGQKLADSLLLDEKLQEFALCREILATQNSKVYFQATYPFVSAFLAYNVCEYLNRRLNLYVAPVAVRGIIYTLTGLFSLGLYFFLNDFTEVYYETVVDKKLSSISPEFTALGVQFYDKILKRNQALRELMGSEGPSKYSKKGNENFGLRQPRIALVHRKQFFEEQSKSKDDTQNVE